MSDLIRDAPIGQIVRWITGKRILQYPQERPDFQLPAAYTANDHVKEPMHTTVQTTDNDGGHVKIRDTLADQIDGRAESQVGRVQ